MSLHSIENEESSLYSKNSFHQRNLDESVQDFHRERSGEEWGAKEKKGLSFMVKLFLITFFVAIGSASFLYYKVMIKPVSVDNAKIDITIDTSETVEGGQENKAFVTIANNNSLPLESSVLTFSYDKGGTLGRTTEKVSLPKTIGTIDPHGVVKLDVPYTVFGQTNEEKKLYFTLSYQIKGSTGVFPKDVVKSVRVSTPPLTVSMVGPDVAVSASPVSYTIQVTNPTATTSKVSLLTLSFPASFSVLRMSEKESDKKYTYAIPVLLPGETKEFKLLGIYTGKVGEKSSVRATVGKPEGQDENDDTTIYSYFVKVMTIATPGLAVDMSVESSGITGTSVRKGDTAKVILVYKNESQNKISNVSYSVRIPESVDASTISVSSGYFDSATRSLVWNTESVTDFSELGARKGGVLSFSFVVPADSKDDTLFFSTAYSGTDQTTHKEVSGSKDVTFTVKGSTDFSAYTLFYDIDSKHGGPIPPVVDKETYVTGVLSVSTETGIKDARVVFSVPALYVKWMGGVGTTSVSYDAKTKLATWNVGVIDKGGSSLVKFMMLVKPSLVHAGTAPQLSSQVVLTGTDLSSGEKITKSADPLTTAVKDAGQKYETGIVIK